MAGNTMGTYYFYHDFATTEITFTCITFGQIIFFQSLCRTFGLGGVPLILAAARNH